jgi:hypothetical protein
MLDRACHVLDYRATLRAGDGRFVKIEKTRAAMFATMLAAEFWFCHGIHLDKTRNRVLPDPPRNFPVRLVMPGPPVKWNLRLTAV